MAKILSVGRDNLFKSLWKKFNSFDRFTKLFIVTAFLIVVVTPFIVSNYQTFNSRGELPWANQISLAIDHTKVKGSLSDFPVLIHLSSSSGLGSSDVQDVFTKLQNDGNRKKIAVKTMDGTPLYVEIVKWDTANKQAYLWVKVPSISSTLDTALSFYYDPNQPDNDTYVGDVGSVPAQAVWSNGYVAVYHMTENGGPYVDSTGKGHTGTAGGGSQTPVRVNSPTGFAQSFKELSHQFITVPSSPDFSFTTTMKLTVSAWIQPAVLDFQTGGEYVRFLGKSNSGQHEWFIEKYDRDGNDRPDRVSMYVNPPNGGVTPGDYTQYPINVGQWVYVTGTANLIDASHGYVRIYEDNYKRNATDDCGPSLECSAYCTLPPDGKTCPTYVPGNAPFTIGTAYQDTGNYWDGLIGEVRVSNVLRDESWVTASYYSESDKLVNFISISSNPTTPAPTVSSSPTVTVAPTITVAPTSAITPSPTPISGGSSPVAIFGLESGDSTYPSSLFNVQRFQNTAGNGVLTKLEVLVNDAAASGNLRLGVYADNSGVPGNLLLDAGSVTAVNGWVGRSGLNLPVAKGAYYWLAFVPQAPTGIKYQSVGTTNSHADYAYAYGALPAVYDVASGEVNSAPFVMRATVALSTIMPTPSPTSVPGADITSPSVTITSPSDGYKLSTKNALKINAKAADTSGISEMRIYLDGTLLKVCSGATSCSISLTTSYIKTLYFGPHSVDVTAIDKSLNKNVGMQLRTVVR